MSAEPLRDRLIVALDRPDLESALGQVDRIGESAKWYKVGLELYCAAGRAAVTALADRGKRVFADTCARCHSSKLPTPAQGLDPTGCNGPGYLACWNAYWASTRTDEFKQKMREIVNAPDFLDGNYLSSEARIPVTLLQTNACSPLATNALAGNIWDNFSSQSYKDLP